jgi:CVNH domain
MSRFSFISFAVLTLAGTLTSDAFADGNYSHSCRTTALLVGTVLEANCKKRDGSTHDRASINLNAYIANDNGNLVWRRDGNFKGSCGNVRLGGGIPFNGKPVLVATCLTIDGHLARPSINLDENIANIDGELVYVGP